jgi:hypothetical protein
MTVEGEGKGGVDRKLNRQQQRFESVLPPSPHIRAFAQRCLGTLDFIRLANEYDSDSRRDDDDQSAC